MMRKFLRALFQLIFKLLTRTTVNGLENIPREGGVIIAANHLGIVDAPLVFIHLDRNDATALVAKKHQKNLLLRVLVNAVDGIWLNRDDADAQAIRAARDHLQKGGMLGIAPEGTRSTTGGLGPGKIGLAYLADKAGVPVVPAAVSGTYHGLKKVFTFQRPRITLQFGKPITLPPIDRRNREASLQQATDEVMVRIAAMLPPENWGVYADHPRLKEILEQDSQRIVNG